MCLSAALALAALVARSNAPDPAVLVVPRMHADRAAALIGRLGDRQFGERDAAHRELEGMGRLALGAVRAGRGSPDAEVRVRCERLLPGMEAEELAARLLVFVADADGRYEHRVPGWVLFRSAAGADRAARDLFAAITTDRANWPLLAALKGPGAEVRPGLLAAAGGLGAWADRPAPAAAAQAAAVRRWDFFLAANAPLPEDDDAPPPKRPKPQPPEIALVLLAETLHPERLDVRRGRHEVSAVSLLGTPAGREALEGKGRWGPAFARVGRTWLDTRDGDTALAAFGLARHIRLDAPTVDRYAARVAGRRSLPAESRAEAALHLAAGRAVGHLGAVLSGFDDPEPVGAAQLRDVMLSAAVALTGQDPAGYGFDPQGQYAVPKGTRPADHERAVAVKRAAAFARWRAWEVERFGAAAGPLGAVARTADRQ